MATLFDEFINSNQVIASLIVAFVVVIFILIIFLILAKIKWKQSPFLSSFFSLEKWPIASVCALIILYTSFPFQQFTSDILPKKILVITIIIAVLWFFLRLITVIREVVFTYFPIDKADNLHERKIRTQFQYIQYILTFIIIFVGIAFIFRQFDSLHNLGTWLLASAGVIGIIIAFAAHQTLGNFLAGLQIAFTQPFRIDDVVIVEGEWGRIEEITFTYVVVRIWDQRRLVLPISYFINNPFQNWTRTTADIWGSVFIYVDYSVPIEKVRDELNRIVSSSDLWDGKVAVLQVTDTSERTITLRALVSARNASDAWSLRCFIREKLISFLQKEYPDSLPRIRVEEKISKQKNKIVNEGE
jgi:small-conductance mechanosensitive channel